MSKSRKDSIMQGQRVGMLSAAPNTEIEMLGPVVKIDPSVVKLNPKNDDFNKDTKGPDWDKFVQDVKDHGIHDPIIVRPDYTLLAGERRTLAIREIGKSEIPARIYYGDLKGENEKRFIIRDNLLRRQLSPERQASLVAKLYAKELTTDNRGKRVKKNLAKTVSEELNMPLGTAKRVVAKARKEANPGKAKPKPQLKLLTPNVVAAENLVKINNTINHALQLAKTKFPKAEVKSITVKVKKLLTVLQDTNK